MQNRKKHALVLGCGRSGTSIFGEFFHDLQGFSYHSEISMDKIMKLDTDLPIALKVPRASIGHEGKEGLSFPLNTLLSKFKNDLQIFWIVRHPLDAICSLKVGIASNWGHHPRPEDWETWLNKPLLEQCAHHWNYINTQGYRQVSDIAHLLHFEDMIANSTLFANEITELVEIDELANQQNIFSWCNRVQNSNNKNFIEAQTSREYSRPDHKRRVGRWRENLTDEEVSILWPKVEKLGISFGYHL